MGEKLTKGFDAVKKEGGLKLAMRLAMKSGMSEQKAASEPDSPENVAKMEAALKEVIGKDVKL